MQISYVLPRQVCCCGEWYRGLKSIETNTTWSQNRIALPYLLHSDHTLVPCLLFHGVQRRVLTLWNQLGRCPPTTQIGIAADTSFVTWKASGLQCIHEFITILGSSPNKGLHQLSQPLQSEGQRTTPELNVSPWPGFVGDPTRKICKFSSFEN